MLSLSVHPPRQHHRVSIPHSLQGHAQRLSPSQHQAPLHQGVSLSAWT